MAVLAVREYERIHCGAAFDPAARTITEAQHRLLECFNEAHRHRCGFAAFEHGPRRSLAARHFVGIVDLGRHQLEVLPKIESDTLTVRHNLARMIAACLELDLHGETLTRTHEQAHSLAEPLIGLFCALLQRALRQGMLRRYEARVAELPVLRGRLLVAQQLRRNLARPDRLACGFDEFSEDNACNQALKAALQVLRTLSRCDRNQRILDELLFRFHDVANVPTASIRWDALHTDRLSSRYAPLLRLARLFVEGCLPDVVTGGGQGFALLFDMNELFERYVGATARRVLARHELRVTLQGPARHLAQGAGGRGAFELRPDIVVSDAAGPRLVIDTKWKRLDETAHREGVRSGDMYQMHAYATQYGVREVLLLYPHRAELGPWLPRRASYVLRERGLAPADDACRVGVVTLELDDLARVPAQLEQMLTLNAAPADIGT
jgi:5-methylcytosine-specific restriction enzyme subunit McrC